MDSQGISAARAAELLARNGLRLESQQIQALTSYVTLLLEWNTKVNLISRKDQDSIWGAHILHSLSVLFRLKLPADLSILDLGTGGGLPGLPLAIARPDIRFTLLDSIRKKTAALEDIVAHLPVGNVRVINGRAEELGAAGASPGPFHIVISRAVAPLADQLKWTRGLYEKARRVPVALEAAPGAGPLNTPFLAALKGGDLEDEVRSARLRYPALRLLDLPLGFEGSAEAGLEGKRLLLVAL